MSISQPSKRRNLECLQHTACEKEVKFGGGDGLGMVGMAYKPMGSGYLKGGWGTHVFLIESKRLIDKMQYFALAWN